MSKFLLRVLFAAQLIAVPFVVSAVATSQLMVTKSTYSANSAEEQAVMAWLQQHAERVKGHLIGEFERVGDVTVTYASGGGWFLNNCRYNTKACDLGSGGV